RGAVRRVSRGIRGSRTAGAGVRSLHGQARGIVGGGPHAIGELEWRHGRVRVVGSDRAHQLRPAVGCRVLAYGNVRRGVIGGGIACRRRVAIVRIARVANLVVEVEVLRRGRRGRRGGRGRVGGG